MLKSCWECIAGERLDNEMIVTPNDYSQNGQWGPEHNEIIFQLPRDLINKEGAIVINGALSPNRKSLRIGFMTGGVNSVKKPLYFITFDYVRNEILFERDENGSPTVEQREKLSNLRADPEFKFYMKFTNNNPGEISLATMFEGVGTTNIRLLSDSEKNIFFSINEDTLKISHLDFIWNSQS